MKFPKFLTPKDRPRNRSKARSEINPTEGQNDSEADPSVAPRRMESTPDLRIGTSTSQTSGPLTSRDQESSGV